MKVYRWVRNIVDFRLYFMLGTLVILISLLTISCSNGVAPADNNASSNAVGLSEVSLSWIQVTSLLGLPRWVWLVVAMILSAIVSAAVTYVLMRSYNNELRAGEKELIKVRKERDTARDKLREYEARQAQIPNLEFQYKQLVAESRQYPQMSEAAFSQLLSIPATEYGYGSLYEQVKSIQAILSYFNTDRQQGNTLRSACLELARQIREDEPALYDTLESTISSAQPAGLRALKQILEQMAQQVRKAEVSPQVKSDLAQLEKSLEGIVDYSIRLMPVRLLGFARDLIASPASVRENAIREKTVQKIIGLVKEYLRL